MLCNVFDSFRISTLQLIGRGLHFSQDDALRTIQTKERLLEK